MTILTLVLMMATIDDARKVLEDGARSKEGDTRRETAVAMSLMSAKDRTAALLEELAKDKDYLVRQAAVESLGELNDVGRVGVLKERLNDEVPEVAFAAAKALFALKAPEGKDALEAVFEGDMKAKSGFVKKEMLNSMRRLKTPKSALLFTVQHGIGFVPVPGIGAGYGAMMGMMGDVDFSARAMSLMLVCREKSKACEAMLAASFADEDWSVRAAGVYQVASKNLRAWVPQMEPLLADKKEKVRLRAAAALVRMEATKPTGRVASKKAGAK